MTSLEQLNLWVDGISAHNNEREECCPDFSCCQNNITTPRYIKLIFKEAYLSDKSKLVNEILMLFMGQLLNPNFDIETSFKNIDKGVFYEQ